MNETRQIVVPGEVVGTTGEFLAGQNTYQEGGEIRALRLGVKSVRGDRINVIGLSGRYEPARGDMVIGTIADLGPSNWYVNIGAANDVGMHVNDVPWRVEFGETSKYLAIGDCVMLKIVHVDEMKKAQVTMKDRQCRKLTGGLIWEVSPTKVPRIVGRNGSMIQLIKDATNVRVFVGQNGMVWVDGESADVDLALEALHKIEEEAHTSGLTDRMKAWLEERRPSASRPARPVEEREEGAEPEAEFRPRERRPRPKVVREDEEGEGEERPMRHREERRDRHGGERHGREERGPRREGREERPARRFEEARPARREEREESTSVRAPARRFEEERPPRREGREERPRRFEEERPARRFEDERPPRREGREEPTRGPARRFEEERPARSPREESVRGPARRFEEERPRRFDEERPARRFEDERPARREGREEPGRGAPRRFEEERPARSAREERPARRFEEERPARSAREERPARRFEDEDRTARPAREERPARRFDNEDRPARSAREERPARRFAEDEPPARRARDDEDEHPRSHHSPRRAGRGQGRKED